MVTGGSSGIGKALAALALSEGAAVTLVARNKEKLEAAKEEIAKGEDRDSLLSRVRCVSADLCGDPGSVRAALQKVGAEGDQMGPVFMLVNCAGTSVAARSGREETTIWALLLRLPSWEIMARLQTLC